MQLVIVYICYYAHFKESCGLHVISSEVRVRGARDDPKTSPYRQTDHAHLLQEDRKPGGISLTVGQWRSAAGLAD